MKKQLLVFILIFLIETIFAVDIQKVTVTYTAGGVSKSMDVLANTTKAISRDKGTPINIRIYKSSTAPSSSIFTLTCYPTGGGFERTSTNASELFSNVGDALTNDIWCMVNVVSGLIRIQPVDLPTGYPDLSPINREVDGSVSSSYKEFYVGQTVDVDCGIYNNGQGDAGSHRTGFYIGTSSSDYTNRFDYNTTGSSPIKPGFVESESTTYTFSATDVGTRYFNFWADYQDVIEEGTAEGNNKQSWGPFKVKEVPLLVDVTQPSSNLTITQGQTVTITWSGGGTGATSVSLRRDNDNTWENGSGEFWIAVGQPVTGSYEWDTKDVPAGSYFLAAAIFNTTTYSYDYATGEVTINPLCTITGQASSNLNNFDKISGATVTIDGNLLLQSVTDNNGNYTINAVPAGQHSISIEHASYWWEGNNSTLFTKSVNIAGNQSFDFSGHCIAQPEVTYNIPSTFSPGVPFDITVTLKNTSYAISGIPAYLDVSFPDLTSSTSDVTIINQSGFDANPQFYQPGTNICKVNTSTGEMNCSYPSNWLMISGVRNATIHFNSEWIYTLRITPPNTQVLKIQIKGSIGDQRWPSSGILGQQGYQEKEITLSRSQNWGTGTIISPIEGYSFGGKKYILREYLGGLYHLVFENSESGEVLIDDPDIINAVGMYYTLSKTNYSWNYNFQNTNSEIQKWEENKNDYQKLLYNLTLEDYNELMNKRYGSGIILYGGIIVAGVGAALTAIPSGGGSVFLYLAVAGGVLTATAGAVGLGVDMVSTYSKIKQDDHYYLQERQYYNLALNYLDRSGDMLPIPAKEELLNEYVEIGGEKIAEDFNAADIMASSATGVYAYIQSIDDVAAANAANIAASIIADRTINYIDQLTDNERNDILYKLSVNDHHQMLYLLSERILKNYGILNSSSQHSVREINTALGELPSLIVYFHLVYEEIACNKRVEELSQDVLNTIQRFKIQNGDINSLEEDCSIAGNYASTFKSSTIALFNYWKDFAYNITSSYKTVTDINEIKYNYLSINNDVNNVVLSAGGTYNYTFGFQNVGNKTVEINNITLSNNFNANLRNIIYPSLISSGSALNLNLVMDLTTANLELISTFNSVVTVQVDYTVNGISKVQRFNIEPRISGPVQIQVYPTLLMPSINESISLKVEYKSTISAQVDLFIENYSGYSKNLGQFSIIPGSNNIELSWDVPNTFKVGPQSMRFKIRSSYFNYDYVISKCFTISPSIEGDKSKFNFSSVSIISSQKDSEIAQRLNSAINNSQILYSEGLTAGVLLAAMQNNNLILIGGDQANLLVNDLVYRQKISSNLWTASGDAHIIFVDNPFAPVAPAGNQAIVIAGYNLEDTYIAGLKLLNEIAQGSTTDVNDLLINRDKIEYNESRILTFPNPVSGILHIEYYDKNEDFEIINIINSSGELIGKEKTITLKQQIDFSKYESGYYILEFVKSSGETKRVKIIKR